MSKGSQMIISVIVPLELFEFNLLFKNSTPKVGETRRRLYNKILLAFLLAVAFEPAFASAMGEALRLANAIAVGVVKTSTVELVALHLAVPLLHLHGSQSHIYTRKMEV